MIKKGLWLEPNGGKDELFAGESIDFDVEFQNSWVEGLCICQRRSALLSCSKSLKDGFAAKDADLTLCISMPIGSAVKGRASIGVRS